jgi:hypothetical protein
VRKQICRKRKVLTSGQKIDFFSKIFQAKLLHKMCNVRILHFFMLMYHHATGMDDIMDIEVGTCSLLICGSGTSNSPPWGCGYEFDGYSLCLNTLEDIFLNFLVFFFKYQILLNLLSYKDKKIPIN